MRGGGRDRERERKINVNKKHGSVASCAIPTEDRTCIVLVHGTMIQPTEPPARVKDDVLFEISLRGSKEGKHRNIPSNTGREYNGRESYTLKTDIFLKFINLIQFPLKF